MTGDPLYYFCNFKGICSLNITIKIITNYYKSYVFKETLKFYILCLIAKLLFLLDEIPDNNSLCFHSIARLSGKLIPKIKILVFKQNSPMLALC